ncbi:hypothetical protein BWI95_16775 [Kosakonia cowanii JCM 10956 = DSM 18146]|jgi:hypothetical protein|uniref:Tlde1 domain-containing protein n=2 Tax=Kosakonia cowanii TaxID=208223 RepID=A0A807LJN9_9ENTR|nr:DUF2778 domain-containing protein [Kosakonia cowanii]APZ06581.1 hypothetical protein BWI95_16775 [Kosakonia cowanii JCM 10956 = DSM 18146]WRY59664.1 DUF2778 domain-containing protein [Kosakonia cowanii]
MALHGTFVLNGADYAPLTFSGIGTFMAFSGSGSNRNQAGCTNVPTVGPLPVGKYWIVDREQGGIFSRSLAASKDLYNKMFRGAEFGHSDWFALYYDDIGIDDWTWVKGVQRGNFRLHPGVISEGCITLKNSSDFATLRKRLLETPLMDVPCMRYLKARGSIEVKSNGYNEVCPTGR